MQRVVRHLLNAGAPGLADANDVRVAVFDTWPMIRRQVPYGDVTAPHAFDLINYFMDVDPGAPPANNPRLDLLRQLPGGIVRLDHIYDFLAGYSTVADDIDTTLRRCIDDRLEEPYDLSSHGLFVVDMINDIAPAAEISVYRVLNNRGVGDMETLARAVEEAIKDARKDRNVRLVLNFSLGFVSELLMLAALLRDPEWVFWHGDLWASEVHQNGPDPRSRAANDAIEALLGQQFVKQTGVNGDGEPTYEFNGVIAALQFMLEGTGFPSNVLAVAAAGNDSCTDSLFDPRIPALFEDVLGISAVKGNGVRAEYSNADDLLPPDDGVGAFGGHVDPFTSLTSDGHVGMYISPFPPSGDSPPTIPGHPNTLGVAMWAGTSFASPIAAAIAACMWSEDRNLTAHELVERIVTLPPPQGGERLFIAEDPNLPPFRQ